MEVVLVMLMSDKSKQNKDSKSVIKNTDTKAVQKDLSAKADASKRAVKKERETKKKQIYIPLGLTLSLVLPSFRKADATETDTSSAIAPLESHSKISAPTVHHATETEHSASATSLVQQNIITTADEKDSNSIHSQAHSSNYSHHPVISHPFMNVGYEVANTHASELQGYQTASPQQPTESTVTYREETLTGKYGTLTVGPDGHYAYNLNPKSPAFILLQGHELGTDSFVIHLSNGLQQTVAVPITGNNEAAQFSGDLAGAVTEDLNVNSNGLITTQGTLAVSDQDHDQDSLVAVHNQATKYGEFSIDESGHWQYQVNNAGNTVQALSSGQMLQETITVHSVDGTEQQIVVTINGQDDTAVISGNDLGSVVEDKQPQVSGKLDVTDPDASQQHFQGGDLVGTLGTLHLQDNGAWTYDLDNTNPKVQALGQAATATDTITVQSADGTTHKVTITVNGTNDKAVIAGTDSGAVTEESQLQTSGTLTVTDVDTGEAHFSNTDVVGNLGTLHLTDSGAWTYDLDNTNPTVQTLGKGATATDIITVQSADGTTHKVTITVNGTNDKAVIAGTDSGAVTEESQLQTSGTLTVTDVDTGEAHFSNTDIAGTLGTLHLTDSGAWTYDLDNTNPTVQALSKGATATDTITVQSADGTTHKVTITVNGTNDKAVIAGTDSGAVTEESQLQTSGTLTVTDVDTGEAHFSNTDVVGTLGTLHLKDNGAWSYDLDNTNPTVQALGQGKTATDTITVQSADGTTHKVTITVNGTNDKAVIAGTDSGAVTEESQLQASGTLTVTDVDTGEAHFSNTDIAGTLGTLHLTDSGAWTYDLDNTNPTVQALSKGATATDTITVQSADGTTHKVTITVNGTNDKAVIAGTDSGAVTEESQLQTSGTLTATDVDTGEAHFSNTDVVGTLGTLHLKDNGAWTYDLDNTNPKVQALGNGATATDTITVHSADGTPHQVKITVNGTNDKAVIAGSDSGAVTEESQLQTSGTLTVTDVDTGEAHFSNTDIAGTLGTLHLKDNGAWTYDLDNTNPTVQELGKGATATDTITVNSADGTPHQITIAVNGTNDTAVIGGSSTGAVTEETQLQTSGTLTVTDTDTGEAHFANTDIQGTLGTLHLTDNGAWTYNLDNTNPQVQSLAQGATTTDVITVNSADGTPHQITITVNGTNDAAVVGGVDTASVTEKAAGDNMSPDHAQPGMATLRVSTLNANGHLSVVDPDSGQSGFADNNVGYNYHGTYGDLILNPNGDWNYFADAGSLTHIGGRPTTRGSAIDKLGEGETLTDTITVHTKDGTPHNIVITINGSNDRPYCSSEVQLNAGTEDTRQTITAAQLLQNSIDVDKNDSGLLTVANLHPDHGSILDNQDGTYTFTPEKDYNGQVHFTYDVKDAHGGTTHTGANTTLVATPDKAIISEVTTGSVIEDGQHANHNNGTTTGLANGQLQVIDSDSGEDKFQYSQFGETRIHDPFGGMLRIDSAGNWEYSVDNSALQHLAQGQVETVTYRVHSFDGTAYDLNIDVVGTNDAPTVTKVVLSNGTEDTHYQMQASQFGFNDIDTGDTLHSIAITDLPPATQGKFLLDGHDVTTGQQIPTADISKLQFVPAQDFNGDVQFKYTVNDGHTDSTEASNTLHIDAVGDKAVITGTITGDVDEGHGTYHDRSPNYAQPGMAKLTNDPLYTDGKLEIIDPDTGEAQFDTKGVGYSYHGTYGQLILNADGNWHYKVTVGSNQQNVATQIDQLGDGQQLTDTITVYSKDGTAQDIVITIHGDNDRPYISSKVTLATGTEDTALTFTKADLLANTVDVDANDAGKLSIANLLVDHGSVVDNKDGTYTFTPDKDYNGQVHFAYDVKDAHGGVTHTGASTTLAAVDDKTIISGVDHGVATEDVATVVYTNPHIMDAVDWQALQITDVDSPNTQVTVEFAGKQYTWNIGSDLDVTTPYGRFQFHTIASGPHQGEHSWSYIGDNNNVHVQELKHGESFTESIKLIATDGTEFPITVKVNGTEDGVVIDSNSELGHVVENAQTGASVSGNVVAHDVDLHDTVSWTQTPTGGISGQYGTFHLSADGQWHYDVDQSKATKLGDGDEYWEHFTVEAVSTDGSHVSKSVSVVVHGNNDVPTVSGEVSLPSGKEDTSIHITQAELIANATDVDTNDRGWLHVENLTADHGNLVSNSDGSFTFNPDPNYNGTVHFTYDVADRHGGIAHTGASTTLTAVNDAATFTGDSSSIVEDTNIHHNVRTTGSATVPDALVCQGHLVISDVDGQGEAALDLKGQSLVSQDGTYGHFIVKPDGSWLYTADNNSVPIQDLDNGQTLTDSIEITSKDGTKHSITVTINGTTDAPSLHSLTDSGIQNSGPIEGNLITGLGTHEGLSGAATDTDSNAHLVLQDIQIKDPVSGYVAVKPGQPHTMMGIGTLAIEANGHYTFTPEAGFSGKVPNMVYRVGDEGGNPIGDSSQNSLSIEVTPRQPNTVSLALATGSDSGSKGDLITNDNTPSVEGHTLIPNSSVDIVENGKVIGTTVSDGNGDYHLNLPGLTDATHTLQAVATDPLSSTQVHSHPLAVVIDTVATISVNPISQDNMLTGSEHTHSFDISGSVLGVEDGQTIEVEIDHHTYQGQVSSGKWSIAVPASVASSLTGGVHQVAVSATDKAGNHAAMHSPLFVVDGSSTPPLPTIQTPHITGGGGVGSHVTGVLIAPPLLQQLHPQVGSGWGILDPHGHIVTHLQGQYGTLVIDPQTGHVDYQYSSAPTAGQKVQGGTHWAGQTTSEQHHDVFQIMYHDTHSSNVDVKVNLDVTYIHGHSGHNQTSTHLVGMSVTPVTPTVQHDEPAPEPEVIEVTLYADDDNTHHDLMAGLSALADDHSSSGSNPYTDIVGLHDAPQTGDSAMPTPEPAPDLDLLLNQGDELAHQHPVDAFIDNNGEEHKADEQHVLDEEHIEHDLPDVMDLPDHHH
ncbi:hypothetical protein BCT12_07780 [Vibrio breoganii]|nr:hypothetical protein BCT12_07780 [Vibrio breoganii]